MPRSQWTFWVPSDSLSLKTEEPYSNLVPKGGLPGESCAAVSYLPKHIYPEKMRADEVEENKLFRHAPSTNISSLFTVCITLRSFWENQVLYVIHFVPCGGVGVAWLLRGMPNYCVPVALPRASLPSVLVLF